MNPSGNRQSPELRPFDNDVVQQTMTNIDHLDNNPNLLLDSDIARMWEIVQVWKLNPNRDARFAELAGKFEAAYNNLSDERRAVITRTREQLRRERERNTPQTPRQPSQSSRTSASQERQPSQSSEEEPIIPERQISVEKLPAEMKKLTAKIKKITENGIVDTAELNSLDYPLLIQVIVQAHGIEGELSNDLYQSLQDLESSLQELDRLYQYRRNNDSRFPSHEKYENFRIDAIKSIFKSAQEYLGSFIDSMKGKNLAKLLITYKQIKESNNVIDKEAKIMFLSDYIIREFILKNENYKVVFGKSGKIEVVTTEWDAEKKEFKKVSDNEVKKILDTLDEKDLKRHVLSEVIDKEKPGNEATVNNILRKYNIKNDTIGDLTFRDIKFEDPENCPVKKAILNRLEESNLSPKEFSDLNFVLDFINKRGNGYDTETMAAAYTLKVFVEQGFSQATTEGLFDALGDTNRNFVNEKLSQVMTLNGGLMGVAIVIAFIVGLFKYTKTTLFALGGIILAGAVEDGIDRYRASSGTNRETTPWENNIDRVSNQFRGVDITVKNLPANFNGKYEELFKKNAENVQDGIEPQSYAQLFAQIGKNGRFLSKNIEEVRSKIDSNASLSDILGEGNVPTEYLPDTIENKSNQPNLSRKIQEEEIRKFLKMLIESKEQGDVSIADIFVPGKLESITYLQDEYFNKKISDIMTGFPLFDPVRNSIEQIFTLKLDNTATIQKSIEKLNRLAEHNNDKKDKIQELVKVLEQMKTYYSYKEEADRTIEKAKASDKNAALDSIKQLILKFERELEEAENIEEEEFKEKIKKMIKEQIDKLKIEYQSLSNKNILEIIQKLDISENSIPANVGMLVERIKEIKVMIESIEDTMLKNECVEKINEKIDKLVEAYIIKLSKSKNPQEAEGLKENYDMNNIKDLGRGDKFTEVYNERLTNINNFKIAVSTKAFGDEVFSETKRGDLINLILANESLKEFLVNKNVISFNQSGQPGYIGGQTLGQVVRVLAEYSNSNNLLKPNIEAIMKKFFNVLPEYNEGLKDIISKTGGETSFIINYSI